MCRPAGSVFRKYGTLLLLPSVSSTSIFCTILYRSTTKSLFLFPEHFTLASPTIKTKYFSGVPGMVARILGARVVLTEQDELLSLLERNLDTNFQEGGRREGIRQEALDWERKEDTDRILASLQPKAVGRKAAAENLSDNPASIGRGGDSDSDIIRSVATAGSNEGQQDPREGVEKGRAGDGEEKAAGAVQRPDSSAPSIDGEGLLLGLQHNDAAAIDVEDGKTEATGGGAARRRNTRLDFLLCAE